MDIGIAGESIAEVSRNLEGSAQEEIDASGFYVLPGHIDAHVHFNEPGRADWEGLETGSTALAAAGGTVFCDMPLNSHPPVLTVDHLQEKRKLAEQKSLVDFALWGGLCPSHVDQIDAMADAGAVGFKAFLCPSGITEFPATDARTLRQGLQRAKQWNLPVGVHAEDPETLNRAALHIRDRTFASFFASRPKEAETSSIRMACEIAGETGGRLHIVHVSCVEGLEEIAKAREQGADVTAEVCAHHLLFDEEAALSIGAPAKCAPPLRAQADVKALWKALTKGLVDTIGSDHSPAPPDLKTGEDFFTMWGGISGCQHAWPCFLGAARIASSRSLEEIVRLGTSSVARRFRLPQKGSIAPGFDADLMMVEFKTDPPITAQTLHYRHKLSLYEGYAPRCVVSHVLRRGRLIIAERRVTSEPARGKFIRPSTE